MIFKQRISDSEGIWKSDGRRKTLQRNNVKQKCYFGLY
ncbi:Uncharacterized protein BM_BM1507 [Brugia malayi]|uniref:Bm1507 n=1 Tax=Brugia malayi TaxID=6279 RepID=A0A0K0J1X7_BRUMA|nr:Uncharacterized protein BM_BM1507 [Brugia malayi]CDQ00780.1 Bm1507 [Brugia malayi]VIO86543.1 Uncharacterized protein BM_BM1507 [Brugia malayi]